jgi:hypothetical protein
LRLADIISLSFVLSRIVAMRRWTRPLRRSSTALFEEDNAGDYFEVKLEKLGGNKDEGDGDDALAITSCMLVQAAVRSRSPHPNTCPVHTAQPHLAMSGARAGGVTPAGRGVTQQVDDDSSESDSLLMLLDAPLPAGCMTPPGGCVTPPDGGVTPLASPRPLSPAERLNRNAGIVACLQRIRQEQAAGLSEYGSGPGGNSGVLRLASGGVPAVRRTVPAEDLAQRVHDEEVVAGYSTHIIFEYLGDETGADHAIKVLLQQYHPAEYYIGLCASPVQRYDHPDHGHWKQGYYMYPLAVGESHTMAALETRLIEAAATAGQSDLVIGPPEGRCLNKRPGGGGRGPIGTIRFVYVCTRRSSRAL